MKIRAVQAPVVIAHHAIVPAAKALAVIVPAATVHVSPKRLKNERFKAVYGGYPPPFLLT